MWTVLPTVHNLVRTAILDAMITIAWTVLYYRSAPSHRTLAHLSWNLSPLNWSSCVSQHLDSAHSNIRLLLSPLIWSSCFFSQHFNSDCSNIKTVLPSMSPVKQLTGNSLESKDISSQVILSPPCTKHSKTYRRHHTINQVPKSSPLMLRGSLRSSIYHRLLSSTRRTFEAFQAHLISISRNTRYSQSACQITQVWPLEDIVRNTTMPQVYPPRLPLKLNEWMTPQLVNPAYRYHNSCSGSFRLLYQVPTQLYHIWSHNPT